MANITSLNALYRNFLEEILADTWGASLAATNVSVCLVPASYATDDSTDIDRADGGGTTYAAAATVYDSATTHLAGDAVTGGIYTATNFVFTPGNSSGVTQKVIIYKYTGTPATEKLIVHYGTGGGIPFATSGGEVQLTWDGTNGLFKL